MSGKLVAKTIRISEPLAARLEAEAKSKGDSFSKYVGRMLEEMIESGEALASSDTVPSALSDAVLKTRDHPVFGSETPLQEINRRAAHSQLLLMQIIDLVSPEGHSATVLDQVDASLRKALLPHQVG